MSMLYWPTSLFMRNLNLPPESKQELAHIGQLGPALSENTLVLCHHIATQTRASGALLVLIHNEGTSTRRAYAKRPSNEEWVALERGGFVSDGQNFGFTLDALH
jgi:hypothetical protein